jgi:hypothetical protein
MVQTVSRRLPNPVARFQLHVKVMWDLWWTKLHWSRFSSSTTVSPANFHFTKSSIHIYHPGLIQ